MPTRVALHPFLAGLNRTQLALLTDCAMSARFKKGEVILREGEFADRFYLIETGKVALESELGSRQAGDDRDDRSRGIVRLVVDVSALRLAFYGPGH